MTLYLLDENVLREMHARGNANVQKWLATVNDADLRISAATLFEKRAGAYTQKAQKAGITAAILAGIDQLERAYGDRIVPIDGPIVAEWARLRGSKNKDRWDLALAATARIRGMVVVTRNIKDFKGRGVHVLDPFQDPPFQGIV